LTLPFCLVIKSMMSAVFRFHLHVGIRLALRLFVPVVSLFFGLYYLLRPELFHSLMAEILDGGFLLSGIPTASLYLFIAGFASRRITLGLDGWIRHLPAEGNLHRRMAGLAVAVALTPVLAILTGLAVITMKLYEIPAAAFLAGMPLTGLACGLFVLPVHRKWAARPLSALAAVSFSSNSWVFIAGGILLLGAADRIAGPLIQKKKRAKSPRIFKKMLILPTINGRALRLRPLALYLVSLPFLGASQLFIANNDPSPLLAEKTIRLGGALGMILFCSLLASMLASRRPPWPWVRSLPWSSKTRFFWDSSFIGFLAAPLVILVGVMDISAMLPLLLSLPLMAVFSAYSIRRGTESKRGPWGKVLLWGTLGSLSLCLFSWICVIYLALTPLVFHRGTKAEQNQKVSRWLELQYLAAGDSLSWSE
jgi:hypothetical protein